MRTDEFLAVPGVAAHRVRRRLAGLLLAAGGCLGTNLHAQAPWLPDPLPEGLRAGPGWTLETVPEQKFPVTEFSRVDADGAAGVRIEANGSYGNLVYQVPALQPVTLAWRWRVEALNPRADLRRKQSDDTSVKVCLLFDMALDRVPFVDRNLLRLARAKTGRDLPAATVCYVWDTQLPAGTAIDNPYSRRVRYLVLRGGSGSGWVSERRDVASDFARLFGDEAGGRLPPLQAVAIGADADNTGARSVAYVADLQLSAAGR